MLRLIPNTLREAASALGAPQWQVVSFITLRGSPRWRFNGGSACRSTYFG